MEEDHNFTDARLESIIAKMAIKEPQDLQCEQKYQIRKLCINPSCQRNSLICGNFQCQCCRQEAHENCAVISLKGITNLLNTQVDFKKNIIHRIISAQQKFISQLKKTSYPFAEGTRFGGLEDSHCRIVQEIYEKKNSKCLNGQQSEQFYSKIKELSTSNPSAKTLNNLLEQYDKILQKVLTGAVSIKNEICSAMTSKSIKNFDSFILSRQIAQKRDQVQFLLKSLNYPKKVERIFRASEHQFKASSFHQMCDNKEDTLVLVLSQFGKIFGGYTHHPWTPPTKTKGQVFGEFSGNDRKAFIFSLDLKQKFDPQEDQKLIYRSKTFGPTFGSGYDIKIADQCNVNDNSFVSFPSTYNRSNAQKLARNKESYRMLCGATVGNKFRVLEYEVFQICFRE